jgi:hypothetical protein
MSAITQAWLAASENLGIRVSAPYAVQVGGVSYVFEAFIRDFGAPGGTLVVALDSGSPAVRAASAKVGAFYSELSLAAYGEYDRQLFIETLSDWGWFGGPVDTPSWLRQSGGS